MPLLALFVWILINKQSVAREHKPSALLNLGMAITVAFSFYMLYLAAIGFLSRD